MTIFQREKRIRELVESIRKLSFSDALFRVFEELKLNKETIARRAFMPVRNIYRYLNEGVTPELDNLVKLLLAMNIPLRLSEALLYSAGYILNSSAKNVLYSILLENHSAVGGILEANEIIEEYNRTVGKEVIPLFSLR